MFWVALPSEPHRYGKAAFEIKGVRLWAIWWRRGESNPCPKTICRGFLRVQTVISVPLPWRRPSDYRAW